MDPVTVESNGSTTAAPSGDAGVAIGGEGVARPVDRQSTIFLDAEGGAASAFAFWGRRASTGTWYLVTYLFGGATIAADTGAVYQLEDLGAFDRGYVQCVSGGPDSFTWDLEKTR